MEEGIESERTLAIVKHVTVNPPEKQNGPYLEERSHLGEQGRGVPGCVCAGRAGGWVVGGWVRRHSGPASQPGA
jgi:hypothetical protein